MREFTQPFYEGKECPCCPSKHDLYSELAWAVGFDAGEQLAEQRIIKLLEERSKCGSEHDYTGYCYCEEIALIKGENK